MALRAVLNTNADIAEQRGALQECAALVAARGRMNLNFHFAIGPVVSLVAGILILVVPRLLNYIVAIYLIAIGLLALSMTSGYI